MSETLIMPPVPHLTPLGGAGFDGIAHIEELPHQGMIALRGSQDSAAFTKAVAGASKLTMPARRQIVTSGERMLAWMSPDELLLMLPAHETHEALDQLRRELANEHAMVLDVSDARAVFRVSGAGHRAREVLAKLAPVDLAPGVFNAGDFRRTRCAQVPAALWLGQDGAFGVMCFRSVARYVFDLLVTAASEGGEVGYF